MSEKAMYTPSTVMVIMAHPDDIEVGCGGTIAKWTQMGISVIYVLVTDGSAGSNEESVNPLELAVIRQKEARSAAQMVGVEQIIFMGYQDGALESTLELRKQLTRLIRKYQPERVITHDPETRFLDDYYINHPDHRAAGDATLYAVFPSAGSRLVFPDLLEEGFAPHSVRDVWLSRTLNANHFEDISATWPTKKEALLCHASQMNPADLEWFEQRNKTWGRELNVEYAEAFKILQLS